MQIPQDMAPHKTSADYIVDHLGPLHLGWRFPASAIRACWLKDLAQDSAGSLAWTAMPQVSCPKHHVLGWGFMLRSHFWLSQQF